MAPRGCVARGKSRSRMPANIVSPAQSGRFYYGCAGAAGLLAGLAIVFWFPAWDFSTLKLPPTLQSLSGIK
ncbi:hypothetical protein FK514_28240 [Klebsiella pneumoniae]|nr:hypothetical protein [Klebsiella pneumoniae]